MKREQNRKNNNAIETCPENKEEKILALAEGSIQSEDEKEKLYHHMAACDSCRHLFKDFTMFIRPDNDLPDESTVPEIAILLKAQGLASINPDYLQTGTPAYVMSGESSEVLNYEITGKDALLNLKILRSGEGVNIEIEAVSPDDRYYLISLNTRKSSLPREGVARFESVEPGRYLISREMRDFSFIKIER